MIFEKRLIGSTHNSLYLFSVLAIISLGSFLRFSLLTNQSLWYDEGISLVLSDADSLQANLSNILNRRGGDKYQPLYYLVLFVWRSLFGDSEFILRTLSVLLGIATIILVFRLTDELLGKQHALWSTLLIASSSFCIYYSQEVRAYSLQLFLAALQLYFLRKALTLDKASLVSRAGFALTTGINFFAGILLVLFSLALCISHLAIYRRIKGWLSWWIPAGVCSVPLVGYYLSTPAVSDPTQDATNGLGLPIIKNALFTLYGLVVGTTYGPSLDALRGNISLKQAFMGYWPFFSLLALVVASLTLSLLTYPMWSYKEKEHRPIYYFFMSLLIVSFGLAAAFASFTQINWLPRHSFYIYLPICILLPFAVGQRPEARESGQKPSLFPKVSQIALIGLVVLNVYSASNYLLDSSHWRDDYRSTAQYLVENRKQDEASIILWGTTRLLDYYGDASTIDGTDIPKAELVSGVSQMTDSADIVFLVVNREFLWSRRESKTVVEKMLDSYSLTSEQSFKNFNIYRFKRNQAPS